MNALNTQVKSVQEKTAGIPNSVTCAEAPYLLIAI